jgi:hypothetical protein
VGNSLPTITQPMRILASAGTSSWLDPRGFLSYAVLVLMMSVVTFGIGWSYFMSVALGKPFIWILPGGILVGLLFGLITGPLTGVFAAVRKVSIESADPLNALGQIAMLMAELGYFGSFQGEGVSTYKPSFQAGLLAGRITIRQHHGVIEVIGPRYYVWRLTSRLGAQR